MWWRSEQEEQPEQAEQAPPQLWQFPPHKCFPFLRSLLIERTMAKTRAATARRTMKVPALNVIKSSIFDSSFLNSKTVQGKAVRQLNAYAFTFTFFVRVLDSL